MPRDNELNEVETDGEESDRGQRIRSQQTYKRMAKPKRRGTPVLSFNGMHRRRKKRVNW